jgi:glycosyltransferase involved in cell wall biosynthesis
MSLRVLVWPMDAGASAYYRLRAPAKALQDQGADVILVDDPVLRAPAIDWDGWPEAEAGAAPPRDARPTVIHEVDADVVIFQRPAARWHCMLVDLLHERGVRVVVDIDDRLDQLHPQSNAFHNYDPQLSPNKNWQWLDAACKAADIVTCSTPALAKRYGFGHVVVLPNLVPASHLEIEPLYPLERTVVWSGNVSNHQGDLEATDGGVQRALKGSGWRIHVIGNGIGVAEALGVGSCTNTGGRIPLSDYAAELARSAIGIVPLADSVFNESKSALKMSEFAAVGVPVVASPSPDNRRVHDLGVGLLAGDRKQWRQQVRRLIDSPDCRSQLAVRGREAIASQTYERQADRWWSAWTVAGPLDLSPGLS